MSDNENSSASEVSNNRTLNEKDVNIKNEQRFALITETELDELVSNAQAQSTKTKTIYAVNIFEGSPHLNIRHLKIAVYGKRLTSGTLFALKTKLMTMKCFITYTIYSNDRKRRTNQDTLFNYSNLVVNIK